MKSSIKISRDQLANVFEEYATITALLADQANQSPNRIYKVIDASDDTNITFPSGETKLHAYYEYKETPNSDIGDYDLISVPFADGGSGGAGDMMKSIYDPSNKNADAFDYDNLDNTPDADIAQGVAAYGWGDHASAGYQPISDIRQDLDNPSATTYPSTQAIVDLDLDDFNNESADPFIRESYNNFTTQEITSGGNYNDLEVTADLLIFTNENAQAILNGVWGKKEFHILNLSETYALRINHDNSSVIDPNKRINLPTASGSVDIKGTARVLRTDNYGYFVADTWASKYRPEFTGLTETEVITVDPDSNADTMPMKELYVYRDAQTTAMTNAELNVSYPNATRPFNVVCSQLNVIYLKVDDVTNVWREIQMTTIIDVS